jgi:hypothetical protein
MALEQNCLEKVEQALVPRTNCLEKVARKPWSLEQIVQEKVERRPWSLEFVF